MKCKYQGGSKASQLALWVLMYSVQSSNKNVDGLDEVDEVDGRECDTCCMP